MSMSLREAIKSAAAEGRALGHFNVSDSVALRAVAEAAGELQVPVLIGVSEGEQEFLGVRQIAALVRSLREAGLPVFLNADHTHSLEKIREAVEAGFDAVLLDGGKLSLEENIAKTREVVEYVRSVSPETIVEGELGYIGSSSAVLAELPPGAALRPEELTSAEQAEEFVRTTGVDLLSPAVGNIHGMLRDAPNPALDIPRIKAIRDRAGVPLVLHGGSGISDADISAAVRSGMAIVHINTELRRAWRTGLERGLAAAPEEVAPYKIYPDALRAMKEVVSAKLRLFGG